MLPGAAVLAINVTCNVFRSHKVRQSFSSVPSENGADTFPHSSEDAKDRVTCSKHTLPARTAPGKTRQSGSHIKSNPPSVRPADFFLTLHFQEVGCLFSSAPSENGAERLPTPPKNAEDSVGIASMSLRAGLNQIITDLPRTCTI